MTRHERLLENYEDAYFALLMEDVAQMENARLDRFNTELQNDPHAAVPEELTKRCLKTINAHFSNMRRSSSLRIVKKAINLAAILIAISALVYYYYCQSQLAYLQKYLPSQSPPDHRHHEAEQN